MAFGCILMGCGGNVPVQETTPADLLARAKRQLDKGDELEAIETLTAITIDYPGVAFIDEVVYRLGEAHLETNDYPAAEAEFDRLLRDYPFSDFADDAAFLLGDSSYRQRGEWHTTPEPAEAAIRRFQRFLSDFPESPLVPDARAKITDLRQQLATKLFENAKFYERRGRHRAAITYLDLLLMRYPDVPLAVEALEWLAELHAKGRNFERACEVLNRLANAVSGDSVRLAEVERDAARWACGERAASDSSRNAVESAENVPASDVR